MSLTARDRAILMAIVPVVIVIAFWFLLLSPKRDEAAALGEQVAAQRRQRDVAVAAAADVAASRSRFAADFTEIVRLGKAVPSTVDVPSLLVQLDAAARGTGIAFGDIKVGDRVPAAAALGAGAGQAAPAPSGAATPAAGSPGQAAPSAQGATAPATPGAGAASAPVPGLDTVPVELGLSGSFSELARMLHRLKRFVYLGGDRVLVRGRLMTIDGFSFDPSEHPRIGATVKATVYLSPRAEGATAGASPSGPGTAPAGATPAGAAPGAAPAAPATPPAAVATR